MAQYKSRPLAAFLLLITVGSLLTASESVQLSEGLKRLSKKSRGVKDLASQFENGGPGGGETASMPVSRRQHLDEMQVLVPGERKVRAAAETAARNAAHRLGALMLTPEQAKAALLDEFLQTVSSLDLSKYEGLNKDQQNAFEKVQAELRNMSPTTKALLIDQRRKQKTLLAKARQIFGRQKYHVTQQAAMAGQFLNEQRDSNGALPQGAVKNAIDQANEKYDQKAEDAKLDMQAHLQKLQKVGALPPE
ncbi:UNVERIFIED_CONTAM: toxofilin [Hammondia hammondi]|eukprot:XP_008885392.1 toxofilin [Hammondia hammondi]